MQRLSADTLNWTAIKWCVVQHSGGLDPVTQKFDRVFLSLYQKHERDNVHYFGTAYQMTFNDLFEKKGFHIYDTETDEIEFVENPEQSFSLQYTDDTDYTMVDFRKFRGSYVKVFVHEKKNAARFDKLIERLYDSRAESVILENEMQKQESKPVDEGTLRPIRSLDWWADWRYPFKR